MKTVSCFGAVRTVLSVAVLSALVACGGGGGDDAAADPTVTLSGVAAKGLLKAARVQVYKVESNGDLTLLKEDVTDTTGSYSLAGIPAGVTVLVKISVVPGTTQIVDEATNTTVNAPDDFVIRAATVTQEGGANTLQVTPFSEMAVAKALADDSDLTPAQKIEGANADIRSYLGYDVLTEEPEFADGGQTPTNRAALMLAAVSELADAGSVPGCTTGTTADKVNCVVKEMALSGTDDGDLADAIEAAKQTVVGDDYTPPPNSTDPTTVVPGAPVTQPTDIVAPTERATAITDAKALIASIRANGPYLGGSEGSDTLTKRLTSVQDVLSNAADPLGDSSRELYRGVVQAANYLGAVNADTFVQGPFEVSVDMAMWGFCTYFKADGTTEATSASDVKMIGCRITYGVESKTVGDVTSKYGYQHAFRVVKGATLADPYAVRSVTVEQKLNDDYTSDTSSSENTVYLSGTNAAPNVGAIAATRDVDGVFTSFSLTGDYAAGVNSARNGYSAKNTVTATLTPSAVGDLTRLSIVGSFAASGGSKATGTAQVANGSYLETQFSVPGNIESNEVGHAQRTAHLIVSASAGDASVTGTLHVTGFTASMDGVVEPSEMSFQGEVKQDASTTLFDGTVTVTTTGFADFYFNEPDAEGNFLAKSVEFVGSLYVPTRAPLSINLTLEAPSFDHYTLTGSYAQTVSGSTTTVNVTGMGQESTSEGASLTFASTSGINFTLLPNTTVAQLTKNGVVIGTFNSDTSRVEYADGSYEQY